MLTAQVAVSVLTGNHQRGSLDAGLVAVLIVHGLALEAVAVRPALIHAQQHRGPVLGLRAAGPRVDGEHTVVAVVLPAEEGGQPGGLHVLLQGGVALLQLLQHGVVVLLHAHLAEHQQVLHRAQALVVGLNLVLEVLDALRDLLGLLHVVPEALRGALGLEQVQLLLRGLQAQGLPQVLQHRPQGVQLAPVFIVFNGCHIVPLFLSFPATRRPASGRAPDSDTHRPSSGRLPSIIGKKWRHVKGFSSFPHR